MKPKMFIFYFCLLFSLQAYSATCYRVSGTDDVYTDLTNSFTSANNKAGAIVTKNMQFPDYVVMAICNDFPDNPLNPNRDSTWRSYMSQYSVMETIDSYQYIKVNDYLSAAIAIYDPAYRQFFYPPVKDVGPLCCDDNVGISHEFRIRDRQFRIRFKVLRPFINFIPIPRTKLYDVYSNTGPNEPLGPILYTISIGGQIEVPQNCIINSDQIIEFDFNKIGAQLFSRAGPGNKPDFINPITKNVSVKCSNVDAANAILTIRVQAENTNGETIQSTNPDIGFKMSATTNLNQTPYTFSPNNINSRIRFKLDDNSYTNIPITAWPISTTGKAPTSGIFTARGYLRVDYF